MELAKNKINIKKKRLLKALLSKLLFRGKRGFAEKIFFNILRDLKKNTNTVSPILVVEQSIKNVSPCLTLVSKKVGGNVYQIPVALKENNELYVGLKWLVCGARDMAGKSVEERLLDEILLAYKKEGEFIKKKDILYQVAVKNRAFLKLLV